MSLSAPARVALIAKKIIERNGGRRPTSKAEAKKWLKNYVGLRYGGLSNTARYNVVGAMLKPKDEPEDHYRDHPSYGTWG